MERKRKERCTQRKRMILNIVLKRCLIIQMTVRIHIAHVQYSAGHTYLSSLAYINKREEFNADRSITTDKRVLQRSGEEGERLDERLEKRLEKRETRKRESRGAT